MIPTREQMARVRQHCDHQERVYGVTITDVWISKLAQVSVGRQLMALSMSLGIPMNDLKGCLTRELYWHLDSDELGIMVRPDGTDVESMYVRIPKGEWGFREYCGAPQ